MSEVKDLAADSFAAGCFFATLSEEKRENARNNPEFREFLERVKNCRIAKLLESLKEMELIEDE